MLVTKPHEKLNLGPSYELEYTYSGRIRFRFFSANTYKTNAKPCPALCFNLVRDTDLPRNDNTFQQNNEKGE